MDILKRLKKKKEDDDSPLSELIKKQPKKEEEKKKDDDIEVKPLKVGEEISMISTPEPAQSKPEPKEEPVFHAAGMRELDFDNMDTATDDNMILKEDYIKRLSDLVRNDKIEDAIRLLEDLAKRMTEGT